MFVTLLSNSGSGIRPPPADVYAVVPHKVIVDELVETQEDESNLHDGSVA